MKNTEIEAREAAGMKFAVIAAIIFGLVGGAKIEFFYHVSFMNYVFLLILVGLGMFYLFCRQLDVLPFIEDESLQTRLKVSAVSLLGALILYIASWNYWPRHYSHFLLCAIPLIENLSEALKGNSFKTQEIVMLAINYVGFFILLTIPDRDTSFTLKGLLFAIGGVVLFWICFQQMKALGSSNLVSIGIIQTLVLSIFLPGFFGVVTATPPTLIELLVILLLGIPTAIGILLMIRSIQITKPSHCLLAASVALAVISYIRSVNSEGFLIQGLLGLILAAGCAIYILYQQQDKTTIMSYAVNEPLVRP